MTTMTMTRPASRLLAPLALGMALGLAALAAPASAQPPSPAPAQKEVTDGFFDVPARAPGEEAEAWGLPAYMVTSAIGGGAIFILCKSSRRS